MYRISLTSFSPYPSKKIKLTKKINPVNSSRCPVLALQAPGSMRLEMLLNFFPYTFKIHRQARQISWRYHSPARSKKKKSTKARSHVG